MVKVVMSLTTCARRLLVVAALVLGAVALAACGSGPLLSDVQSSAETFSPAQGTTLNVSYRIGREALVDIYLLDERGASYYLRQAEPRSPAEDPYTLRFDGTVPTSDPLMPRRLLPNGAYTVIVAARDASSNEQQEVRLPVAVAGSDVPLPAINNLIVSPQTISPNADAIDDVAEFTYSLPVTATVDIVVASPDGQLIPVVTREEEGPFLQQHVWNGKRPDGALLPAGVYTYTVSAEDVYGNLVRREGNLTLADVGQPEARIVYASIAPQKLMLGETLTVTIRVRNTGTVPIRTYGPPSGYQYTTDEVFSSVEDGRYTAQAGGFWRVGLDWDANSGGGPKRYPFRWALSEKPPEQWRNPGVEDWLMPGEEVEIVGQVVVLQRETKMGFYVGLIQDGVGFFQDRTGRTIVEVGL
jgi:hypothetical protein